jgi:hypothetical protein
MKREVPFIITLIVGIAFIVQYFIPHPPFDAFEETFNNWFAIVGTFAILLGAMSLFKISMIKVARKQPDWPLSFVIIICFLLIVVVGFIDGYKGIHNDPPTSFRDPGTNFDWLYVYIYTPLSSTMFAILAFFVASASYRAFRARNVQATLLLLAGFFVMIGRVPLGDILTWFMPHGFQASDLASWLMNYPHNAGQRAIKIGVALGIVSTSLRIILGIERSHLEG